MGGVPITIAISSVRLQHECRGVAGVALAVDVDRPRRHLPAVAADAVGGEPDSPDAEELTEVEFPGRRRLDVDNPRRVVRVQLGQELAVVDSDVRRDGHGFAVHEDVEMLVDMQDLALRRKGVEADRVEPVGQVDPVPRRRYRLQAHELARLRDVGRRDAVVVVAREDHRLRPRSRRARRARRRPRAAGCGARRARRGALCSCADAAPGPGAEGPECGISSPPAGDATNALDSRPRPR